MTLFAEFTAEGWVLVIGAIFFGIQQVLKMILDYKYNQDQRKRDEDAADKQEVIAESTVKQNDKLDEIHKGVNGMNRVIEEAGFARGVKSEKDKTKPNEGGKHGDD